MTPEPQHTDECREAINKYIAWAPHMPECRIRHGFAPNDCDCGLAAIRQIASQKRPAHVKELYELADGVYATPVEGGMKYLYENARTESGLVKELAEALEDAASAFALFIKHYPNPEIKRVDYRVKCVRVSEEAIRDIDAALAKATTTGHKEKA